MHRKAFPLLVMLAVLPIGAWASPPKSDGMCAPLRQFVLSVRADETKSVEFHTSWLSPFKDMTHATVGVFRRCNAHGYEPGKLLCNYLLGSKNTAVEFAGNNVKRALMCLSPGTRFGPHYLLLESAEFQLNYGPPQHGAGVTLKFGTDTEVGGAVFVITARGY